MATDWVLVNTSEDRVLIVDDDDSISAALCQKLVARGIRVDIAADEPDAERLLVERNYAVVLIEASPTGRFCGRAFDLLGCARTLHPSARIAVLTGETPTDLDAFVRQFDRITLVPTPRSVDSIARLVEGFLASAAHRGAAMEMSAEN